MTFDRFTGEFLRHFKHVKQTDSNGYQWCADCPACNDKKQHLYIKYNAADEKILLDCKHGCKFDDILTAAHIPAEECFKDKSKKAAQWELIREHVYTDIGGNILAKKQIYRKPDGNKSAVWHRLEGGHYVKGLNGIKLPPYHLHKFTKSTGTLVIVEGEKDAETMERLGYVATTSPNGAGAKWRTENNKYLRGRNVVIITDNDDAGRKYGEDVARNLYSIAETVRLIHSENIYPKLQEKGDISDIAAAVGDDTTKRLLNEAVQRTGTYIPAADDQSKDTAALQDYTPKDEKDHFKANYVTRNNGRLISCDYNFCKYLLDNDFTKIYYLNTFSDRLTICDKDGDRDATDDDLLAIRNQMINSGFNACNIGKDVIYNAIRSICPRRNPVQDYFKGLQWDGTPRAERLLIDLLGAPDDTYVREATKIFLLGIISRVFNPGTKFDYMIVLQGRQGLGKSSFFKALAIRPEWYGSIGSAHMADKKLLGEDAAGKIIVEYEELDGIRKTTAEKLKATITRTDDQFRIAFDRLSQSHPRKFVIGGTTNSSTYLSDPTGNRRFLPIPITKQGFLKSDEVNQVWAETYEIYKRGDFKLYLPSNIDNIAENYRENVTQLASDDYIEDIAAYLDDTKTPSGQPIECTSTKDIYDALQDKAFKSMRYIECKDIIKQALEKLGWIYKNKKVSGVSVKSYWRT